MNEGVVLWWVDILGLYLYLPISVCVVLYIDVEASSSSTLSYEILSSSPRMRFSVL